MYVGLKKSCIVVGHRDNGEPVFRYVYGTTQKELHSKLHLRIKRLADVEPSEDGRLTRSEIAGRN